MMKLLIIIYLALQCEYHQVKDDSNVVVEELRGKDYVQALSIIGRIEFREIDNMMHTVVVFKDSLLPKYDCGLISHDVEKISFYENSSDNMQNSVPLVSKEKNVHDTNIRVYPNPTSNFIYIDGLLEESEVRLFNVEGKLILSTKENTINISYLSSGMYLLFVNKQLIKIVKK